MEPFIILMLDLTFQSTWTNKVCMMVWIRVIPCAHIHTMVNTSQPKINSNNSELVFCKAKTATHTNLNKTHAKKNRDANDEWEEIMNRWILIITASRVCLINLFNDPTKMSHYTVVIYVQFEGYGVFLHIHTWI